MIIMDRMTIKQMRKALPAARRVLVWANYSIDEGYNFEISKAEVQRFMAGRDGAETTKTFVTDDGRMFIG